MFSTESSSASVSTKTSPRKSSTKRVIESDDDEENGKKEHTDSTKSPSAMNSSIDKKDLEDAEINQNDNTQLSNTNTETSSTTTTPTQGRSRKRANLGLDGGYWASLSTPTEVSAASTRNKRSRTTVERLDLSSFDNTSLYSEDLNDDKASESNASLNNSTQTTPKNYKDRFVLFKSQSFLTVRNETGSFFLCQAVNSIYEDSKKCKIQWLEDFEKNKYKFGLVDWIDPFTIISKVNVRKVSNYFQIEEDDLKKVNDLLEKALKDGGITVEFSSSSDDEYSKSAKTQSDSETEQESSESSESSEEDDHDDDDDDDDDEDEPKSKKKKASQTRPENNSTHKKPLVVNTKPPAIETSLRKDDSDKLKKRREDEQRAKNKHQENRDQSNKTNQTKSTSKSSNDKERTSKVISSSKNDKQQKLNKKPKTNEIETDELDSEQEEKEREAERLRKLKKLKQEQQREQSSKPKEPKNNVTNGNVSNNISHSKQTTQSSSLSNNNNNNNNNNPNNLSPNKLAMMNKKIEQQNALKRRLKKVLSNRHLEENSRIEVYLKDPFFEQPNATIPYVSPYVQSKLTFKAIYLNDLKLLKSLIDDYDRIPSVHIGRAVHNKWIPAEYALYMENQEALDMLIDDYCNSHKHQRIQMPEMMFEKFSTGNYSARSYGTPYVRKLTESRGAKEGNNALIKDSETMEFLVSNRRAGYDRDKFFKNLFFLAFEYGSSIEIFDYLLKKWHSLDSNKSYSSDVNNIFCYMNRFIYEAIYKAVLFGHRKLAAHVLESAPQGHGFNAVHIEVLKADNDADLTCKLRANMCVKKPYANDSITPIHCACINPNVKYLKTLLSITQDFNIADKRGRRPVHYAAVCEGPTPLEYLITRVSPYELDSAGNTALHFACLSGRSKNVEVLLNYAQAKQEDDTAQTTEVLIDNKFGLGGINKPNKRGLLPLHLAISRNNYDCVKLLIKFGCNLEYPLPNSMGKITPLMYACQLGYNKIIKLLIDNNAKIEARDRYKRTAIIHATMCGHARALSYLLRLGSNPNVSDSSGNSCLHYACAYGWYHCMRLLLDAGANVNVSNDWKLTPFGAAFLKGHVGVCDDLTKTHKIDVNFRTEDGETLVMLSVSSNTILNDASVQQLDYIVNKLGGNCQLVDSKGDNAFHHLAANLVNEQQIQQELRQDEQTMHMSDVEFKKLIRERVFEQETLRHKMAEILLKAKCDANAENNQLKTPLFTAIECGNYVFARYLLTKKEAHCKITSKQNSNGKTLLSLMAEKCLQIDACFIIYGPTYENFELMDRYFNEFVVMAKIKDENELTPFQIACENIGKHIKANEQLPSQMIRFMKFLYKNCKSNPNDLMLDNQNENQNDQGNKLPNQPMKKSRDAKQPDLNKSYTTPVFKLLSDKCVDLMQDLYRLVKENENLVKIDFNFMNSDGLTPLLAAIVNKQTKLAHKLIDLGIFDSKKLKLQVSTNEEVYHKMNILQMAITYEQPSIFKKVIDVFCSGTHSIPSDFVELLSYEDVNKRNFLHTLALKKSDLFDLKFLRNFKQKMDKYLLSNSNEKNILAKLLESKDKHGRNPLHLSLMHGHSAHLNNGQCIDLELFFIEHLNASSSNGAANQMVFNDKDKFARLPLHYLFHKPSKSELDKEVQDPSKSQLELNAAELNVIDPVELLTLLIKNTSKEMLDDKDVYGFTALHYAAIRGATISCTMLISSGADYLARNFLKNTPLSSAIYFKRETCALTLLRSIEEKNKSSEQMKASLRDFYYLNGNERTEENGAIDDDKEPNIKLLLCNREKSMYKEKSIPIYKLILSHKWEGVSWLILGNLQSYGLSVFDSIELAIKSHQFSLALRVIEKYEHLHENKYELLRLLTQKSSYDHGRTLLHIIANMNTKSELLIRVVEKVLKLSGENDKCKQLVSEYLLQKDNLGSTAFHYACYKHNFDLLNYILRNNTLHTAETLFVTNKDAFQQTAYSLLFWQVGRIAYDKSIKDTIKSYTFDYIFNSAVSDKARLDDVCKAFYPQVYIPSFNSQDLIRNEFIDDYPNRESSNEPQLNALLHAINRQSFDMCKFMLKELGFDVNTTDSNKVSALVYAIKVNSLSLTRLLMDVDYEPQAAMQPFQTNKLAKKAEHRINTLFKTVLPSKPPVTDQDNQEEAIDNEEDEQNDDDDDDDDERSTSEIDEVNDEEEEEEEKPTRASQSQHQLLMTEANKDSKFKVKSDIILNQQDNKQRTLFHHLALSLSYGSFCNLDIGKLLLDAYNFLIDERGVKMQPLNEFLKRVDSNVISASDYAIKSGNLDLYEEFKRVLLKTNTVPFEINKLAKFTVNDTFYANQKPDFYKDSDTFLRTYIASQTLNKENPRDLFKVDPLSNMNKIGSLVWDNKHNVPYDVLLTKTDVSYGAFGMHNFYKMQLITHAFNQNQKTSGENENSAEKSNVFDEKQMCVLFTRWGRIGEEGQYQRTPFANFKEAHEEFCKIFKQKTANDFVETCIENKKSFENKPRRYNLVKFELRRRHKLQDIDFELFDSSDCSCTTIFDKSKFKTHEFSNDYKQFLIDLLDVNYLKKETHLKTNLSHDYLPLTQLSTETIERAANILMRNLKPLIERRMDLEKLSKREHVSEYMSLLDQINKYSNEYYELIPQMNNNYEKLAPIWNEQQLDAQVCIINQLNNSQIACRILMGARMQLASINPFDYVYNSLNCKLEVLNPLEKEAQYILRYIYSNEQDDLESKFNIKRIFKFERPGEQDRFDKVQLPNGGNKIKNRTLLWHGTCTENLISIMSRGLIKAPNDTKWNGHRYGKGLYFSDSFEFSSSYSSGRKETIKNSDGSKSHLHRNYMLLCEVALGKVKELRNSYELVDSLPSGFDSVKALGRKEPDPANNVTFPSGCVIPLGKQIDSQLKPGENMYSRGTNHSQYVIYNESQVCIRYIVQYYTHQ